MRFLGNVLATIVGLFVFFMILFFGMLFLAAIFGGETETKTVEKNSVIELDLSNVQTDYAGKFNFEEFDYYETKHDGLSDVIKAINAAKTDDKIKGISILNNEGSANPIAVQNPIDGKNKNRSASVAPNKKNKLLTGASVIR